MQVVCYVYLCNMAHFGGIVSRVTIVQEFDSCKRNDMELS